MKKQIELPNQKVSYTISGEFELEKNMGLKELLECIENVTEELRGIASVEAQISVPQMIIKI